MQDCPLELEPLPRVGTGAGQGDLLGGAGREPLWLE